MKPLEHRRWFGLFCLAVSVLLMVALWHASALPLEWKSSAVFLLSVVGLSSGVNKLFALALIRLRPGLGEVG